MDCSLSLLLTSLKKFMAGTNNLVWSRTANFAKWREPCWFNFCINYHVTCSTPLPFFYHNVDSVTSKKQPFVCICCEETLCLSLVCYRSSGNCETVMKSDALWSHFFPINCFMCYTCHLNNSIFDEILTFKYYLFVNW